MHVVLICTSLIIQLYSVLGEVRLEFRDVPNFSDVTFKCLEHKNLQYSMTYGRGPSNSHRIRMISKESLHCSIKFSTRRPYYILGLFEFYYGDSAEPKVCLQEYKSEITISDKPNAPVVGNGRYLNVKINLIFSEVVGTPIQENIRVFQLLTDLVNCHTPKSNETCLMETLILKTPELVVNIQGVYEVSILIVTTVLRDPGSVQCIRENEVDCLLKDKLYCMDISTKCDGYANCGVPKLYDEDVKECIGAELTPYMIFCIMVMHVMTVGIITSLFIILLPKRKETFAYKFDQSVPLFDAGSEDVAYGIDIIPLLPNVTKPTTTASLRK